MRNAARGDVLKVWLYAAAAVALGVWMAPLLFDAGKALAEVAANKSLNDQLEWLAEACSKADFPRFYVAALWLAAAILFFPWLDWLHGPSGGQAETREASWLLRLLNGWPPPTPGQPLRRNAQGWRHGGVGFLLAAGPCLVIGMVLIPAGVFTLQHPQQGIPALALRALAAALAQAVTLDILFRGIALGVFLRAMRPAAALGMNAALFALVLVVIPPPELTVMDPETTTSGGEMLSLAVGSLADWRGICGHFIPLLALGGVLAYARWRTASLWLSGGLLTGWWFAATILNQLTAAGHAAGTADPVFSATLRQSGLLPLAAILLAGIFTHTLTAPPRHEPATPA